MNESSVVDLVRKEVEKAGSMRALATKWGVSPAYLSDLLNGHRSPGPAILGPLGLKRVKTVVYEAASA